MNLPLTLALVAMIAIALVLFFKVPIPAFGNETVCTALGQCFSVVSRFDDAHKASAELARLNSKNLRLIRDFDADLRKREKIGAPLSGYDKKILEMASQLRKNYNPEAIREHVPESIKNTSYVWRKGQVIAYCLRDPITEAIHDPDTLFFVNLHELTHLASPHYNPGHDKEFWADFYIMLDRAQQLGYYSPRDYRRVPVNYCGLKIDYNPLFDASIEQYARKLYS